MSAIEPNLTALVWFAALWSICCIGFLQIIGMYPLRPGSPLGSGRALVIASSALWLALAAGTLVFAWTELRPTTTVIAGGLLILFIPGIFQALPGRWRDGRGVSAITAIVLSVALVMLFRIAALALGAPP